MAEDARDGFAVDAAACEVRNLRGLSRGDAPRGRGDQAGEVEVQHRADQHPSIELGGIDSFRVEARRERTPYGLNGLSGERVGHPTSSLKVIHTSSRRRPGPIGRGLTIWVGVGILRNNDRPWLWVPAFARPSPGRH